MQAHDVKHFRVCASIHVPPSVFARSFGAKRATERVFLGHVGYTAWTGPQTSESRSNPSAPRGDTSASYPRRNSPNRSPRLTEVKVALRVPAHRDALVSRKPLRASADREFLYWQILLVPPI